MLGVSRDKRQGSVRPIRGRYHGKGRLWRERGIRARGKRANFKGKGGEEEEEFNVGSVT